MVIKTPRLLRGLEVLRGLTKLGNKSVDRLHHAVVLQVLANMRLCSGFSAAYCIHIKPNIQPLVLYGLLLTLTFNP